jgi:hypothetical protein
MQPVPTGNKLGGGDQRDQDRGQRQVAIAFDVEVECVDRHRNRRARRASRAARAEHRLGAIIVLVGIEVRSSVPLRFVILGALSVVLTVRLSRRAPLDRSGDQASSARRAS